MHGKLSNSQLKMSWIIISETNLHSLTISWKCDAGFKSRYLIEDLWGVFLISTIILPSLLAAIRHFMNSVTSTSGEPIICCISSVVLLEVSDVGISFSINKY